jgi:hypothetical protein
MVAIVLKVFGESRLAFDKFGIAFLGAAPGMRRTTSTARCLVSSARPSRPSWRS